MDFSLAKDQLFHLCISLDEWTMTLRSGSLAAGFFQEDYDDYSAFKDVWRKIYYLFILMNMKKRKQN